jgi:chromosome partitioning protein
MSVPVLTFFNNTSGVGKTSLAFHVAWMLSELGKSVVTIDLDPQANLTAGFLPDETLEGLWESSSEASAGTIFQSLQPLMRTGDLRRPRTQRITEKLHLIPGDLLLSSFEDSLSEEWPKALGSSNLYRPFRMATAFWQLAQMAAEDHQADIILADVGPHLGAINRSALIASDCVIVPLAADLFSIVGLKNLGPTLRNWRRDWRKRVDNWPDPEMALPEGRMAPIGYILMQHGERLNRPVKAYRNWSDQIPARYRESVLGQDATLIPSPDPNCIAQVRHYRSLAPMAQEHRKPIFHLTAADGAIGGHAEAVRAVGESFRSLSHEILSRMAASLNPT